MIRTSHTTYRRAAAVFVAAAILSSTAAYADIPDIFGGTINNPASLGASSTVTLSGQTVTGIFGVTGYSGSVTVGAGAVNTVSEGFSTVNNVNRLTLSQTGVAAAAGTTVATKSFGPTLSSNTLYAFTLTRVAGSTVGVLGSLNIALDNNGTIFLDTRTGVGLASAVDVLGLFDANGQARFTFTAPANLGAGSNIGVTFTGGLPVNSVGGAFTLQNAAITQVPEPCTVATMLLGISGLAALRIRRRLRAA